MNPKTGAAIIGFGVFFLVLINVEWEGIEGMVGAYTVLGMGLVCIAAFFTALRSDNEAVEIGTEVTFQIAGGIAAAVVLGTVLASIGGFPFWDEEYSDGVAMRGFQLETQLLTEKAAILTLDVSNLDMEIVGWGNPEILINGTIKVYSSSNESAEDYLNNTSVRLVRDSNGGLPRFRLEVESPGKGGFLTGPWRGHKLSLTIRVPSDVKMDLDIQAANGKFNLADMRVGVADLGIVNGAISFQDVIGENLSASTLNGKINGSLSFETADLSILIGGINVSIGKSEGRYTLKNRNGNIWVRVPVGDDVGLSLHGDTINGEVDIAVSGLDQTIEKRTEKKAETPGYDSKQIQISIEADTLNGDVRVLPIKS